MLRRLAVQSRTNLKALSVGPISIDQVLPWISICIVSIWYGSPSFNLATNKTCFLVIIKIWNLKSSSCSGTDSRSI